MLRHLATTIAASLVLFAPSLVWACTVCLGGETNNREEFIGTTALLTFLPLMLIGGVIYGLVRRARRLEQEHQALLAEQPSSPQ